MFENFHNKMLEKINMPVVKEEVEHNLVWALVAVYLN